MLIAADEISVAQAARVLGISRAAAYQWANKGFLPTRRREDGHRVVPIAAITEMRRAQARKARFIAQGQ